MTRKNPPEEDVEIVVKSSGRAAARGTSFGRLAPAVQEVLIDLEDATEHLSQIDQDRRHLVREARALGASWHQIGLSLRTTGEAARQRYMFDLDSEGIDP